MVVEKTKRDDVLRQVEVDRLLERASKGVATYIPNQHEPTTQHPTVRFPPEKIKCLIALLWLFGKRITENLQLKRKHIRVDAQYLYVHYMVLKKRSRQAQPIPQRRLKRMTLLNPYTEYVLEYVEKIEDPEAYLFPSTRSKTGYLSRNHAYRILHALDKNVWCHLFRRSLATEYAERGATAEQLMAWFDWDRADTAHQYVKGGPKLTEQWSQRTW